MSIVDVTGLYTKRLTDTKPIANTNAETNDIRQEQKEKKIDMVALEHSDLDENLQYSCMIATSGPNRILKHDVPFYYYTTMQVNEEICIIKQRNEYFIVEPRPNFPYSRLHKIAQWYVPVESFKEYEDGDGYDASLNPITQLKVTSSLPFAIASTFVDNIKRAYFTLTYSQQTVRNNDYITGGLLLFEHHHFACNNPYNGKPLYKSCSEATVFLNSILWYGLFRKNFHQQVQLLLINHGLKMMSLAVLHLASKLEDDDSEQLTAMDLHNIIPSFQPYQIITVSDEICNLYCYRLYKDYYFLLPLVPKILQEKQTYTLVKNTQSQEIQVIVNGLAINIVWFADPPVISESPPLLNSSTHKVPKDLSNLACMYIEKIDSNDLITAKLCKEGFDPSTSIKTDKHAIVDESQPIYLWNPLHPGLSKVISVKYYNHMVANALDIKTLAPKKCATHSLEQEQIGKKRELNPLPIDLSRFPAL